MSHSKLDQRELKFLRENKNKTRGGGEGIKKCICVSSLKRRNRTDNEWLHVMLDIEVLSFLENQFILRSAENTVGHRNKQFFNATENVYLNEPGL